MCIVSQSGRSAAWDAESAGGTPTLARRDSVSRREPADGAKRRSAAPLEVTWTDAGDAESAPDGEDSGTHPGPETTPERTEALAGNLHNLLEAASRSDAFTTSCLLRAAGALADELAAGG